MTEKKNVILDATILSTLMSCARLLDFRYNRHYQALRGKSNSIEIGSIIHKVLEVFYYNIIKGFKRQDAIGSGLIAGQMYISGCSKCADFEPTEEQPKPGCGHQLNEYPGVQNTPAETSSKPKKTGYNWALETCEQYFDFYKNDHWVPLEVEVVKSKIMYEDDELRIMWKAKLDLIGDTNQGIYPIDHKSESQNRDTLSLNNQFIGQCMIMGTRSIFINKIGLQTSLKPEDKFKRVVLSYSADRLLEWQSQILPYWTQLLLMYTEGGYFPPNFTHCDNKYGNCQFKDVCEADRGMREEEIKNNYVVGIPWNPASKEEEGE